LHPQPSREASNFPIFPASRFTFPCGFFPCLYGFFRFPFSDDGVFFHPRSLMRLF
jgi:hypothetical protein